MTNVICIPVCGTENLLPYVCYICDSEYTVGMTDVLFVDRGFVHLVCCNCWRYLLSFERQVLSIYKIRLTHTMFMVSFIFDIAIKRNE